jgi:flagellar secretion chaperone FliS
MSSYADAQSAYARQSILTAPPERLVIMLYDTAIRFLAEAAAATERKDIPLVNVKTKRVAAIIDELDASLDMSYGELPARLRSIYGFCKDQLITAMLQRDAKRFNDVAGLLSELREAWVEVAESGAAARAAAS